MSSEDGRSRRHRGWRPNPDTALALVALVLAAGGGGYALGAGAGDQVITACFDPASGSIPQKIIAGTDCGPGQTALSWGQVGPQGLTGPQGPAGPPGAQVPPGPGPTGSGAPVAPPTIVSRLVDVGRVGGSRGPSGVGRGGFVVNLELPGPGTYELDGRVSFDGFNGVVGCRITRDRPTQVLDTVVQTVSPTTYRGSVVAEDIQGIGEQALITVAPPAPSDSGDALSAKVNVAFRCSAPPAFYKRRSPKSGTTRFIGPTLSATPVSVYRAQKVR